MMQAEIDPRDIERLTRTIERAVLDLDETTRDMTRQAMVFAIQSAARETGPGKKPSPKKMENRFKYRKIVRYPGRDFRYAYRKSDGKTGMFVTDKRISPRSRKERGLRLLTRNIEIWDRRLHVTRMIPYFGKATTQYDKESSFGRIPHYGAAKAGWLKALGKLPGSKPEPLDQPQYVPTPRVSEVRRPDIYGLIVENIVKYVEAISPNAAGIAMRKTANRMEKIVQQKIDKKYKGKNL